MPTEPNLPLSDPSNNFTVPETQPGGLRIPEFAIRQLIGWGIGQVRSTVGTPGDTIDKLFALVPSDAREQFKQWVLQNQNIYLDVSWPRDPVSLALIVVEPQSESEDTSNTFLNDSVGTTYNKNSLFEAPAYGIPENKLTNIYIGSDDDRLTLFLYVLVKFILLYNKMNLEKFYDVHNLSLSGGVIDQDAEKLPQFVYYRVMQLRYMSLFDFNGVTSGPVGSINLGLNVAEFIGGVEVDTTVEPIVP